MTATSTTLTGSHTNGGHNSYSQQRQNGGAGRSDVCVVGAGPAGLMLGTLLARFGQRVQVIDERPDQTTVGRADGIQPKSIETLQMLRLGDELLRTGVRVHDICMWQSSNDADLRRLSRSVHYPASVVDVLQPYILLCHQGMMEAVFIEDLRKSGVEVQRSHSFQTYCALDDGSLQIDCDRAGLGPTEINSEYLVGCDGARSLVRKSIPGTYTQGTPHTSVWGVLDGELETDFPDIWSKTVVFSEQHGSILIIPRERNMTRFYIEMKSSTSSKDLGEEYVMEQAQLILAPYSVKWRSVEWFGNYQVAQRVAARFSDASQRAFIAGDASHTHSPKAAQGMNTSIHDSWNLGWKLNLALRGLAKESVLLGTYEQERKKIAHDLIDFDFEHANEIARGDAKRLAENFKTNTRFISGVGVEYGENELNRGCGEAVKGSANPGCNLPPAKLTRYIDACPVDAQLDIPVLGQFRVYVVSNNVSGAAGASFLGAFGDGITRPSSLVSRLSRVAAQSYESKPRARRADDIYVRPERYTPVSQLCTFALITSTDKNEFEIASLPPLLAQSGWTVYLDDAAHLDTQGRSCTDKWLGGLLPNEAGVIVVRPDGYVGSISRWSTTDGGAGELAAQWLDDYFGGFLHVADGY
ncbi:FAD binding domain-containing protein [Colletotrichum navitas]|uniref:FAD binding domain-containing protein n=1 Tax=Colletotrichum navitas TaxID=681940 RepID=A0AAD8PN96_9PEZI|nr:FAD binding domain-containing protein [Colletotrichum navitas]KAK1572709.1 FAD binding domain-containing protein [Colletotrichum navitas]